MKNVAIIELYFLILFLTPLLYSKNLKTFVKKNSAKSGIKTTWSKNYWIILEDDTVSPEDKYPKLYESLKDCNNKCKTKDCYQNNEYEDFLKIFKTIDKFKFHCYDEVKSSEIKKETTSGRWIGNPSEDRLYFIFKESDICNSYCQPVWGKLCYTLDSCQNKSWTAHLSGQCGNSYYCNRYKF